MSDADVARDLSAVLSRVQAGFDVVVEHAYVPVAVIRSPEQMERGGVDSIALAKAYEAASGELPMPDDEFADDVRAAVDGRRDCFEPPAWD